MYFSVTCFGLSFKFLFAQQKMEHILKQNNSVDIYEEYFSDTSSLLSDEPPSARTISILRLTITTTVLCALRA